MEEKENPKTCKNCGLGDHEVTSVPIGSNGLHFEPSIHLGGACRIALLFQRKTELANQVQQLQAENERLKNQLPIELDNFVHLEALQDLFEFACTFYESNYEFAGYSARSKEQTAFLESVYQKVTKLYWERRLSNMESEG